ncbi:MAG: diacylglycerol kinase family protein [Gemmataceae bacterium]
MAANGQPPRHSWTRKVGWAVRGVLWSIGAQRGNFAIHLATAAAVLVAGFLLQVSLVEWCLLVMCIAAVLAAELFNTALEQLARAITREHSEEVRNALDAAAGAVLVAAKGAAIVGAIIFISRLGMRLEWWG